MPRRPRLWRTPERLSRCREGRQQRRHERRHMYRQACSEARRSSDASIARAVKGRRSRAGPRVARRPLTARKAPGADNRAGQALAADLMALAAAGACWSGGRTTGSGPALHRRCNCGRLLCRLPPRQRPRPESSEGGLRPRTIPRSLSNGLDQVEEPVWPTIGALVQAERSVRGSLRQRRVHSALRLTLCLTPAGDTLFRGSDAWPTLRGSPGARCLRMHSPTTVATK